MMEESKLLTPEANPDQGVQVLASFRRWFWVLALLGFLADQASKYVVFAALYNDGQGSQVSIIPNAFQLTADFTSYREMGEGLLPFLRTISGAQQPTVNKGALFGLGTGSNFFFGVVSLLAALALMVWSMTPTLARDRYMCVCLGLILGGTLGNLYDRIVFSGVRDFLHWYKFFNWPVFNLADCYLVCGAGLLLFQAFFLAPHHHVAPASKYSAQETV
jgi:lipoprotein signal peptidase